MTPPSLHGHVYTSGAMRDFPHLSMRQTNVDLYSMNSNNKDQQWYHVWWLAGGQISEVLKTQFYFHSSSWWQMDRHKVKAIRNKSAPAAGHQRRRLSSLSLRIQLSSFWKWQHVAMDFLKASLIYNCQHYMISMHSNYLWASPFHSFPFGASHH